jgi:hypothetical protein
MTAKKQNTSNHNNRPNAWGMIRDIFIASLNKGQFPIAVFGIVLIILVAKLPSSDASKLLFELVQLFKEMHLLGWLLSFVFLILWYLNARKLRKFHTFEITRISQEKKELQETLIGKKLQTSN